MLLTNGKKIPRAKRPMSGPPAVPNIPKAILNKTSPNFGAKYDRPMVIPPNIKAVKKNYQIIITFCRSCGDFGDGITLPEGFWKLLLPTVVG